MSSRFLLLLSLIAVVGCNSGSTKLSDGKEDINAKKLEQVSSIDEAKPFTRFEEFNKYYDDNIRLSQDFLAYGPNKEKLSKTEFLEQLATGKFQPLKINPADTLRYLLQSSPARAEETISDYLKMYAEEELRFYKMEGKPFPDFSFVSLDGNKFNNQNIVGKILVVKCWFINCAPCIKEIPQLNKMVAKYKDRNDILFIGLATDKKAALKEFLDKTTFHYQNVSDQKIFIENDLTVSGYPTHFIVDKKGILFKVVYNANELEFFLERKLKE